MTNFIKSGDNLTLAAPYDVLSGGGFKVGNVFGVAANDTLSGADVECNVEGVYDLTKDGSTFAQGDLAYWDDSAKKVSSTVASVGDTNWYTAADPSSIDTIEYCYLEGQQGVYIETRQGFEVDGVEIKARLDFAAAAIDYRGLQKNTAA